MKEEHCPECQNSESIGCKLSCSSKSVFKAYLTLRDWPLKVLTDQQIAKLGFKLFVEQADRDERMEKHNA